MNMYWAQRLGMMPDEKSGHRFVTSRLTKTVYCKRCGVPRSPDRQALPCSGKRAGRKVAKS